MDNDCIICLEKKECVNMNGLYKCTCMLYFCEECFEKYNILYSTCPLCRKERDMTGIQIHIDIPRISRIPEPEFREPLISEERLNILFIFFTSLYLAILIILSGLENIYIDFKDQSTINVYRIWLTEFSFFITSLHFFYYMKWNFTNVEAPVNIQTSFFLAYVYLFVSLNISLAKNTFTLWNPMYFFQIFLLLPFYIIIFIGVCMWIYRCYMRMPILVRE